MPSRRLSWNCQSLRSSSEAVTGTSGNVASIRESRYSRLTSPASAKSIVSTFGAKPGIRTPTMFWPAGNRQVKRNSPLCVGTLKILRSVEDHFRAGEDESRVAQHPSSEGRLRVSCRCDQRDCDKADMSHVTSSRVRGRRSGWRRASPC
jgi:hypothetical protein